MILIIAINTIFYESFSYIISIWKLSVTNELISFIKILGIEVFYNILLTIIIYPCIQKVGEELTNTFKNKNIINKIFMI